MKVKIWGSRGSLPSPQQPALQLSLLKNAIEGFLKAGHQTPDAIDGYLAGLPRSQGAGFGGNTPCVEIKAGGEQLIIDGGSGLRLLGLEMLKGPAGKGKAEIHILYTHFHWDHLIGLPFFVPIFIPGNQIHIHAVQPELEEVIRAVFKKPFFPVPFEGLGAKVHFHRLEPRQPRAFGGFEVTPYQLDHPDPCWGYRVAREGKAYAHCVDTECKRVSREELGADLPLYQGIDLMVFDAQYSLVETIERENWGHATATLGLDIAMREGIKQAVFMHHDPSSPPDKIAEAERMARRYYESQLRNAKRIGEAVHEVNWSFGYDQMEIEL
jgi:phosphoribosyl 1,2-cyclic phosphodiesterase